MKVSIIVPIYNVEKYIRKCIDSLLNQTFYEILIFAISDGSPDRSVEILKEYSDERLLIFEKENGGYGSVLEYALKKITTKYFLICDPDDWLERDAIEKLYKSAENLNTDLTIANFVMQYSDGMAKNQQIFSKAYRPIINKKNMEIDNFAFATWSPHSKLYVTEFAKNINFPHKVSYTDAILYLVYLSRINSAAYIDEYLANYLIDRPGNTVEEMLSYSEKAFNSQLIVYDYIIEQLSYDSKHSGAILRKLILFLIEISNNVKKSSELSGKKTKYRKIINRIKALRVYSPGIVKYSGCAFLSKHTLRKIYFRLVLAFPNFFVN